MNNQVRKVKLPKVQKNHVAFISGKQAILFSKDTETDRMKYIHMYMNMYTYVYILFYQFLFIGLPFNAGMP